MTAHCVLAGLRAQSALCSERPVLRVPCAQSALCSECPVLRAPCALSVGDSLDLTPPVLTHPAVSTRLIRVDGHWLGGSVAVAGRTHPVILVLMRRHDGNE